MAEGLELVDAFVSALSEMRTTLQVHHPFDFIHREFLLLKKGILSFNVVSGALCS